MTVADPDTIDSIHLVETSNSVLLWITVPLTWSDGGSTQVEQLRVKLNAYLNYVLCGELIRRYPQASNGVEIRISCLDRPGGQALDLLRLAKQFAENNSIKLNVATFEEYCVRNNLDIRGEVRRVARKLGFLDADDD